MFLMSSLFTYRGIDKVYECTLSLFPRNLVLSMEGHLLGTECPANGAPWDPHLVVFNGIAEPWIHGTKTWPQRIQRAVPPPHPLMPLGNCAFPLPRPSTACITLLPKTPGFHPSHVQHSPWLDSEYIINVYICFEQNKHVSIFHWDD